MEGGKKQSHFVLVHGACHGAWCWYKLKPLLESSGHRVTTLDLAASGIDTKKIEEIRTIHDYNLPLMETMASVPVGEKVVLVGHSLGGMNLAFAMDKYPEKVSVAVFVSAFMPDSVHKPSYAVEEDLTLATMLTRPGSLFIEDMAKLKNLSKEGYGSVARVFIVCNEDEAIVEGFQRWVIENSGGVKEVMEINGADHMVMLSKPQELCSCLLEIANKHA